jgi:putative transposase
LLPSALADGQKELLIKFGFSQNTQYVFSQNMDTPCLFNLVFSTKNREPFLTKDIRANVHQHIIENCKEKEIYVLAVNGYTDHLHCLISLGKEQSIAKIAQLIKGESSFWINKNNLCKNKFSWQDDYFAVSVSESQVDVVKKYIQNQEQHHSKAPFSKEVEVFMEKYNWSNETNQK